MSGLEIYGALAATASLVKVAIEVKKFCNKTAEELKALEQAKISDLHHFTSLRTVFKSLALSFGKYNADVFDSLSQEDRYNIGIMVKDTTDAIEKCKDTMSKFKDATRKRPRSKAEFGVLRGELDHSLTTIQCLQSSFHIYIQMETFRRVSLPRRESEPESFSPPSRQATIDSTWSMQTLTSPSSEPLYSTGSSSGSSSCSSHSTLSTDPVERIVEKEDCERFKRLIGQKITEAEKKSLTASALFQACTLRRESVVHFLLNFNPNVSVIDDSGSGVMHATIGLSEQLSAVAEQVIADILKLLVNHHPALIRSRDKQKRQPLHYCAMTGNYPAAKYILSVDPSRINATDGSKKTPLYHICEHHSPNKKVVELLLQHGGDFETRNRPMMKGEGSAQARKMLDNEERKRKLTRKPKGKP